MCRKTSVQNGPNRSMQIITKGKGSGIASKGKDDPKKRMVTITLLCEKEV